MKILLVNPLWSFQNYPPVNLTELAAYLIKNNFKNTKILDLNYEIKNKLKTDNVIRCGVNKILSKRPDVVALTCNALQFPFVCELSKELKKQNSRVPVVIGGVMASLNPAAVLKRSNADYVIRGEGEAAIVELMKAVSVTGDKKNVPSISYKNGKGGISHNKSGALLDINKLPLPAFNLIAKNLKGSKLVWLVASRGCAYKCKFCSGNALWHYQRRKNPEDIYKQLYILKTKYGIADFVFGDDCLTLDKKWLFEICAKIKSLKMKWGCLARIDSVDEETSGVLKKAGCKSVYHGIESGSAKVRELLDKRIKNNTNKFIIDAVKREIKAGLRVTCSFMTGIPFETKKDINDTYLLAKSLQKAGAKIQLWLLTPYHGLQIIKDYKKQLVEADRTFLNLQSDVFDKGQFYLYREFINKYNKFNPDNYIFLPKGMKFDEFISYFGKVQKKLNLKCGTPRLTDKEIFILKNRDI